MYYSFIDKFKNFAIQHRRIVVLFFCCCILGIFAYVFNVSYAERSTNGEFDEIQKLIAVYRENDKKIQNKVQIKKVDKVAKGIDVSSWQGEINFSKVKKSGVDFVIIRCGFRQQVGSEIKQDKRFEDNIKEATKYGIPVGVYFYSTAITQKEVLEEASFVLNLIDKYEIIYPVVYDFEMFNSGRTKGVSDSIINKNAKTFLSYIEEHGYNVMLYSNLRAINKHWKMDEFKDYKVWFAQYLDKATYEGEYEMWQYSDTGRVDGIKGNVDLNESYVTYEKVEE